MLWTHGGGEQRVSVGSGFAPRGTLSHVRGVAGPGGWDAAGHPASTEGPCRRERSRRQCLRRRGSGALGHRKNRSVVSWAGAADKEFAWAFRHHRFVERPVAAESSSRLNSAASPGHCHLRAGQKGRCPRRNP
uniref:Uncharacterized protein n=1 Tax=Rousettus aegyptiacus TaxID=9407 RepID=A0A7J8KBN3_ROUAE|nr:hypothetical protein HJG63_008030 [Rousettus aegyptiacus]